MDFPNKIHIDNVVAIRKTPRALVCEIDGDTYVVPDSQIDGSSDVIEEGDEGELVVNEWWAHKEGLA